MERLTEWLRGESYVVATAADGPEAIRKARTENPDLILMDRTLPGLPGDEVARELKRDAHLGMVPIILLSRNGDPASPPDPRDSPADDLISDPGDFVEVNSRVRTMLKKRDVYLQLEQANQELKEANQRLKQLVVHDEKTGLFNYRSFAERLGIEFRRARRYREYLSLMILDLDRFKDINDRYGHPSGDEVLREFAQVLARNARDTDLVARYGGDEFVILLPETAGPHAFRLAERIRQALERNALDLADRPVNVTTSAGIATYPANPKIQDGEDLIRLADRALYQAKEGGRNRTVLDPQSIRGRA